MKDSVAFITILMQIVCVEISKGLLTTTSFTGTCRLLAFILTSMVSKKLKEDENGPCYPGR